jgi:hypothetical protein
VEIHRPSDTIEQRRTPSPPSVTGCADNTDDGSGDPATCPAVPATYDGRPSFSPKPSAARRGS